MTPPIIWTLKDYAIAYLLAKGGLLRRNDRGSNGDAFFRAVLVATLLLLLVLVVVVLITAHEVNSFSGLRWR